MSSHKETQEHALTDESVAKAEEQARALFSEIETLMADFGDSAGSVANWIFGGAVGATVLDAHIVPFIARLLDCGRKDLVPERLQDYAHFAQSGPAWEAVTHGRTTMFSPSIGHVHLLKDL